MTVAICLIPSYGLILLSRVSHAALSAYFVDVPPRLKAKILNLNIGLTLPGPALLVFFVVKEEEKGSLAGSLMARYDILSNVFTQLELRALSDHDHIRAQTGKRKGRGLYLLQGF